MSSLFGKSWSALTGTFGGLGAEYLSDRGDAIQDWFTGASSNRKAYHYQMNLDSANRAWQARQAEIAYERQKDFFDYNANYNTPANQVKRLEEAGLNPHLVYGNGAMAVQASTGSAPQASGGHSGSMPFTGHRGLDALGFLTDIAFKAIHARKEARALDLQEAKHEVDKANVASEIARRDAETAKTIEQTKDIQEGLADPRLKYIHRNSETLGDFIGSKLAKLYDGLTGNISGKSWFTPKPRFPIDPSRVHKLPTTIIRHDKRSGQTQYSFDGGKTWENHDE